MSRGEQHGTSLYIKPLNQVNESDDENFLFELRRVKSFLLVYSIIVVAKGYSYQNFFFCSLVSLFLVSDSLGSVVVIVEAKLNIKEQNKHTHSHTDARNTHSQTKQA